MSYKISTYSMYPSIQPHKREWLRRDRLSTGQYVEIYVECSGNPKGVPVIYLHGGPGIIVFHGYADCMTPNSTTLSCLTNVDAENHYLQIIQRKILPNI